MWWLLAVFMMVFITLTSVTQSHDLSSRNIVQVEAEQQSMQTVAYLNAINDYLYSHPMTDGIVSDDSLPVKAPNGTKNLIQASRVYVYQPNQRGLLWQLENASDISALVGIVSAGRLTDASGTDMGVAVPSTIPNGDIVYLD
ncbi:TPA: type IV pilus biogenesis protein PilM [Salmonella enterica subsp. salamae serovar 35:g,m,s,t:-]|nr:type IV pilus biogenesis protein PilM [Salmonella enterica subsp. salamae serovar 35:g,m,s,t:-]HCA3549679.1 type IV pilus biogenesis protein PilM [Salmonella enterica subsp. salamae serovar 35:g,m,s,t:-]